MIILLCLLYEKSLVVFILYLFVTVFISFVYFLYINDYSFEEQPKYLSYTDYIETIIENIDSAITVKGKIVYALFLAIFIILHFAGITASGICNLVTDFIHNNFDFNGKENNK